MINGMTLTGIMLIIIGSLVMQITSSAIQPMSMILVGILSMCAGLTTSQETK